MKLRRPFILIEVLASLALVALCAYPLLVPYTRLAAKKVALLRTLQLEQMSDSLFCKVQEKLYEGEISWSQLIKAQKTKPRAILDLGTHTITTSKEEHIRAKAVITVDKMHSKDKRKHFRLFDIAITFNEEETYHYFLYGERLGTG